MKIKINRDRLLKSVSIVDSLIPSRSVNAVLSNCLFNVSRDEIEIISTDNEIGIRTIVEAEADSEISFTANGKRFQALLKELSGILVEIDVNDSYIIDLKTDIKGDFKLIGSSDQDYPKVPGFYKEGAIEIKQQELKAIIKKVIYAAATDTIKPVFNGIFFVSEAPESLTVVATDSRRLSVVTKAINSTPDLKKGIIIPLKTVAELMRLLTEDKTCYFSINENQCFFKIGSTEIVSRIVDGQFPNYKQVIPKEQEFTAVVETEKLIEAIRRAMIFTREPANKTVLTFTKNILRVEVKTPELGECKEEISIEFSSSEEISIGLNALFLMDSLREMESNSITIGITGQMNPVTIKPDNDANFVSVIMPIKIKSLDNE